jgi:signal transduction histidine kinase
VDNLIDNAIRYNLPQGCLRVTTDVDDSSAHLVVENSGPLLEEHAVHSLGRPFRRLGADRTGSAQGVGLGLSIVAAIVAAHEGSLELHARPEGGLQVIVHLPLAPHMAEQGA